MTCKTDPFNAVINRRQLLTMSSFVDINGQEIEIDDQEVRAARLKLLSITPDSASPIVPQLLTLELNDAYDSTNMPNDSWKVGLMTDDPDLARPNGDMVRWLNVVSYDTSANTITVKYGGAYSGKYKIVLES